MQNHPADKLDVKVAHAQHAPTGLANDRESLDQDLVQNFLQQLVAFIGKRFGAVRVRFGLFGKFARRSATSF